MKKFAVYFVMVCCLSLLFSSCKKQEFLDEYVEELRSNCFVNIDGDISLKANYGFSKSDKANPDLKVYTLTFMLLDPVQENITYSITLNHNDKEYVENFKLNPIKHNLCATFNIDGFSKNEFSIILSFGSENRTIKMQSSLPKDTLSPSNALKILQKQQSQLLSSYYDQNGNFSATIILRVLIKDQKPYWYVGLKKQDSLKALLIDGINGNLLAVRDVF